jgi:hypothetical protein
MKNTFLIIFISLITFSCSKNESVDLNPQNIYDSNLSIEQNLNNGISVLEIIEATDVNSLYGIEYGGGYIFHVNIEDGSLIVATVYRSKLSVSYG